MSAERSRIDELVLRVPGLEPGDARAFADEVARRLADRLRGTGRAAAIAEVRVDLPAGLTRSELVEAIVERIARSAR